MIFGKTLIGRKVTPDVEASGTMDKMKDRRTDHEISVMVSLEESKGIGKMQHRIQNTADASLSTNLQAWQGVFHDEAFALPTCSCKESQHRT